MVSTARGIFFLFKAESANAAPHPRKSHVVLINHQSPGLLESPSCRCLCVGAGGIPKKRLGAIWRLGTSLVHADFIKRGLILVSGTGALPNEAQVQANTKLKIQLPCFLLPPRGQLVKIQHRQGRTLVLAIGLVFLCSFYLKPETQKYTQKVEGALRRSSRPTKVELARGGAHCCSSFSFSILLPSSSSMLLSVTIFR